MFFVCLNKSYDFHRYGDVPYEMRRIIRIPESLYLFELLLQGKTNLIGDCDISRQLSLFDIQYVDKIDVNILKNICNYELLNQSYNSVIEKVDRGKDVIGKVRALVKK